MRNKTVLLVSFSMFVCSLWAQTSMTSSSKLNQLHTYAPTSVLAQGKFVKIRITDSGIYKLTFEDLTSMGINPANVRILGYGGGVLEQNFMLDKIDDLPEAAIWMEKGTDGVFNAGDYILFYAQGVNRWSYDATKLMFTHTGNSYSSFGYYFVSSDAGTGKKISDKTIVLPSSPTIHPIEEFVDYQVYEKDLINLVGSGKVFYGETFKDVLSYSLPFSFPNTVLTNSTTVCLDVAASRAYNGSNFTLSLNGEQPKILTVPNNDLYYTYEEAKAKWLVYKYTPQSDTFTFNLTFDKPTTSSAGFLNYLEVNARRQLKMSGSVMQFQNVDFLGTNSFNKYLLSNANANTQIWDITDPLNISKMATETLEGKVTFIASGNEVNRYVAIDPTVSSAFPKPEIIGVIPNQNLHGIAQTDMVIITHPNFVTQAETLAQAHRQKDNLTVAVVTTDQVYNEFSSGTPDATAYRWVTKMLYDRAQAANNTAGMPKYLLLFGRGSYDNRKILPTSGDNLVMTYQADNSLDQIISYVTDDYFALLDDNKGTQLSSDLLNIGVGRFPVTTAQQATDVVNKTIGYMNNSRKGNWKNQLCFLADDGDNGLHRIQADTVAAILARTVPAFQTNKIYLDAYTPEISAGGFQTYPLAKSRFMKLLHSGLFLLDYTGHAGPAGWTFEKVLTTADIDTLSNTHLPVWVGSTADFSKFDVQAVSGGERVVLNPVGGGIGILAATRLTYSSQNFNLNKLFCENLFKKVNGENQRVGDVIKYAKNYIGSEINKLSYVYLGDPAVKLNYPTAYQVITGKINGSTIFGADTLRALSANIIQGFISDANGNKVNGFNGTLHVVMYDKLQRIKSMNNYNDQLSWEGPYIYLDRTNTLFEGDAQVVNGEYSISVLLPADIYNFGGGRINYYAQDDIHNYEAQGYFENFIVGSDITNGIDVVNGSSTADLSVSNYPNPAKTHTRFVVSYDRPETVISATVEIYDISGRKIWSLSQPSLDNMKWDLSSNGSQKVKAGIYLYHVKIKTTGSEICSKDIKLIIVN